MKNYARLEKNIVDMIKEEQVKLGYCSETVRLYYPLQSLNQLLQTNYDVGDMLKQLQDIFVKLQGQYGEVEISHKGERFCIKMPPKAADYIHANTPEQEFIVDFVRVFQNHHSTIEDALAVFRQYSDAVHVEKKENGEFDYLVYFENGEPDDYRYLISVHDMHMTYHRFTLEDYQEFGFA